MALASEGVEKQLARGTGHGHRRRPPVGPEGPITPHKQHANGRRSEGAPAEPTHDAPDVGLRLGIKPSRLPARAASANVFVVNEELMRVAGPIGSWSTER